VIAALWYKYVPSEWHGLVGMDRSAAGSLQQPHRALAHRLLGLAAAARHALHKVVIDVVQQRSQLLPLSVCKLASSPM
jgi:hypothetical protein